MKNIFAFLLIGLICLSIVKGTEDDALFQCGTKKCNGDSACTSGLVTYSLCVIANCNSGDELKDANCIVSDTECAKISNQASVTAFKTCLNEMLQAELAKSGSSIISAIAILISGFFLLI